MNGTFRVPPQQPFLDFLTLGTIGVQILKFTRVRRGDVACLLPGGVLRGTLDVLANIRLSDDLERRALPVALVNLTLAVGMSEMQ